MQNDVNFDFDLQCFAEGGGEGTGGETTDTGDGNKPDADKNTGDKDEGNSKNLKTPEEVDKAVKAAIAEEKASGRRNTSKKRNRSARRQSVSPNSPKSKSGRRNWRT